MKRTVFCPALFCALLLAASLVFPASAHAAGGAIDTSTASEGYFTVSYGAAGKTKMKVGVTQGPDMTYYSYVPGDDSAYTFPDGDGMYTITLYRNVSGTTYKTVTSAQVDVEMDDPMAPYLVSTEEITFSVDDAVSRKADELCAGLTDDGDKVTAIYRFMAAGFTYDRQKGAEIQSGQLVNYVPDTERVLAQGTGICYDFSALFAAMCRSQRIPCAIVKGDLNGSYHAWNRVYVDGAWSEVDVTRAVANRDTGVTEFADCVMTESGYTGRG